MKIQGKLEISDRLANGDHAKASGYNSHAEGMTTITLGQSSHAEGEDTKTIGTVSHAEGFITEAIGSGSHAEGQNIHAMGYGSHAEGQGWFWKQISASKITINPTTEVILNLPDYNFPINTLFHLRYKETENSEEKDIYVSNTNNYPKDYEYICKILGDEGISPNGIINNSLSWTRPSTIGSYSHAEGEQTTAYGSYSHAEGDDTETTGSASHAEGQYTHAKGNWSHAEGIFTKAEGDYSHAEGYQTRACGTYSHAEGYDATSGAWQNNSTNEIIFYTPTDTSNYTLIGNSSHAEGHATRTTADYQHVSGTYNADNKNALFIVGNGTSNTDRKNILEVEKNTVKINGNLNITGAVSGISAAIPVIDLR